MMCGNLFRSLQKLIKCIELKVTLCFLTFFEAATVGAQCRSKKQCLGEYVDRGNPCFILVSLWVQKDQGKAGEKVEQGFVLWWNWVAKDLRHVKVCTRAYS